MLNPAEAAYLPLPHKLQPVLPEFGIFPARQFEHDAEPVTEYFPDAHVEHAEDAVRVSEPEYLPAAQLVQEDFPANAYFPFGQNLQVYLSVFFVQVAPLSQLL